MYLVKLVLYAPLFNRFGPMEDKALEAKILALADRAGIEGGRVYEVDKSRDTKTVNAYVTGLANTKRIVLWDTLLHDLDERQVLFVMGHEMGHYALGHVVRGILFMSVLMLVALGGIHVAGHWFLRRYHDRIGFDRLADVASLPLLLLLITVYTLLIQPVGLAWSRHIEHEA